MGGSNIDSLVEEMGCCKVLEWIEDNDLILNLDKTNSIFFGPKILTNKINLQITLNNFHIKRVSSIKFLGIIITSDLNWIDHILYIKAKIFKNLGVFY